VSEAPGNLFGRAALSQVGLDVLSEPGIQGFTPPSRQTRSGGHLRLIRAGAIGAVRSGSWLLDGSGYSGFIPGSAPSFGANTRGSGPRSRSPVFPHSGVDRIEFAWQYRSPYGLVVLHLEVKVKMLVNFECYWRIG
jgi:hypothetical protein